MPNPNCPVPAKAPAAIKKGRAGSGSPICSAKTTAKRMIVPCCVRKRRASFIPASLMAKIIVDAYVYLLYHSWQRPSSAPADRIESPRVLNKDPVILGVGARGRPFRSLLTPKREYVFVE